VSDTLPLTWHGEVDSVADEAILTATLRMGGTGPSQAQALAIQSYVDWSRQPVRPPGDTELVAQGEALFQRADVACASCHVGEAGTDGLQHDLLGLTDVDTPTLRGIGATAPYFHDGSAATLRDVLERSRDGSMGNTGALSDQEMAALEAYLKQR
jgi:mono/diheme cytochrome c family protein